MNTIDQAKSILRQFYGYNAFRPLQEDIIRAALDGKDAVVLMPTGGGKSLCFQIPALVRPGMGLVISPLIALMKDQVEALLANGIKASYLNSSQSQSEARAAEAAILEGKIDLLYVSPEKVLSQDFLTTLSHVSLSLIAIDEAHCISQWGHDFRPEYTQLHHLKQQFPQVPLMALTATADKLTRKDIMENLGMIDPQVFVSSFDRPNLRLSVLPGQNRYKRILDFIKQRPGQSGIVYCLSRRSTEEIAEKLEKDGIKALAYHAGMPPSQRSKTQEAFIKDDVQIICATIAFGMGIDKPNIRWVIHYNLPKNIESFYQEIGRAGRDGLPSDTMLLYTFADVAMLNDFIKESAQREILETKLERMVQYADAKACRRRILLSYFSENLENDCGNCDNCQSPPERMDGTVFAQKALSAVVRTQQKVGSNMLADILRGSTRQELLAHGYDKIKTYGAGADVSRTDWMDFILQFLNQGLVELAYDEGNVLKITEQGQEVLRQVRSVELVKPQRIGAAPVVESQKRPAPAKVDMLFEKLRKTRKRLAEQEGVPPYIVFGDQTLREMAEDMPTTRMQMKQVTGVSERKLEHYGADFITVILEFLQEHGIQTPPERRIKATPAEKPKTREKGGTFRETWELYQRGMSIEQIAGARGMAVSTITGHFFHLYQSGEFPIDPWQFVSLEEADLIWRAQQTITEPGWKPIFEKLEGAIPYEKIRMALAIAERQKK